MARVYSTLFAAGPLASSVFVQVYTVPAGKVAVVKDARMVHSVSGSSNLYLSAKDALGVEAYLLAHDSWPGHQILAFTGTQVLPAGHSLWVYGPTAGYWYRISGFLFDAP